jgi:hypothetical protein
MYGRKKETRMNTQGKNSGRNTLAAVFLAFMAAMSKGAAFAAVGEPVPGAKIYVELDPNDEPFAKVVTDSKGEFSVSISKWGKDVSIPATATFTFEIKKLPSKYSVLANKVKTTLDTNGKSRFHFKLTFEPPTKAQNKGCFAVSGKSST